jgi:glycine/serine hydroxymethyltransferase
MADMAHLSGLVSSELVASSFEYADVAAMTLSRL